MLTWLDGRNASSFEDLTWTDGTLSFDIAVGAGANGLRAMLPTAGPSGSLQGLDRNGIGISVSTQTIKGVEYAVFAAVAGSYEAIYADDTTGPAITDVTATASGTALRPSHGPRTKQPTAPSSTEPMRACWIGRSPTPLS